MLIMVRRSSGWFPPEVIVLAERWYLRFGLSLRNVEQLLAERGIELDHVMIYRWVRLYPVVGRGGPVRTASGRGPLVCRRDLCEGSLGGRCTCTGPLTRSWRGRGRISALGLRTVGAG